MAYDVYFDKVLLPVAPSKIKTKIKNKNKTIELINEGEVNMLKDAGLTEFSFSLLLPNQKYPFAKYPNGFQMAVYYLNILEEYKRSKKPFQLIISRTLPTGKVLFHHNVKVSLEDYNIDEDVKEGFDIVVSVNLLQHKDYGTKTVNVTYSKPKTTTTRPAGEGANNSGKSYIIKSGDTLWGIAKKKLGNGIRHKEIYDANKAIIENEAKKRGKASSNNGHWIWPGTKITIP